MVRGYIDYPKMRAILNRCWQATVTLDLDSVNEFYYDDVIVEGINKISRVKLGCRLFNPSPKIIKDLRNIGNSEE